MHDRGQDGRERRPVEGNLLVPVSVPPVWAGHVAQIAGALLWYDKEKNIHPNLLLFGDSLPSGAHGRPREAREHIRIDKHCRLHKISLGDPF
jgi:hypothetical protein